MKNVTAIRLQPIMYLKQHKKFGYEVLSELTGVSDTEQWFHKQESETLIALYHKQARLLQNLAFTEQLFMNLPVSILCHSEQLKRIVQDNPLATVELQDPERLEYLNDIEIQRLRNGLDQLRQAGFNIWFDDYQHRYVNQLTRLNYYFDGIKLDRSDFLSNRSSPENLSTIITQAREFGQLILIEGIETENDLQVAIQANADLGQGFYWPEMKVAC